MNDKITDLQIAMVSNLWQYLLRDFWHAMLLLLVLLTFFLAWRGKKSVVEVWFNGYVDDLIRYFTTKHKIDTQADIQKLGLETKSKQSPQKEKKETPK